MPWAEEFIGWLSEKLIYDDVGHELNRISTTLRSGGTAERLAAIRQLTFMKAADSNALLIAALKDSDARVRAAAASAFGYKRVGEAVTPLALLLDDPDPEVRRKAVAALDEIGSPPKHSWVRFWRERVVSHTSDPRIPDILGRGLMDPDPQMRTLVLAALPHHGSRGVTSVREYFRDGEKLPEDLAAAREGLIGALSAREADQRTAALQTMFEFYGQEAVRPLSEALKDPSPEVRRAAVEAVTALGPRAVLDELLERLDDSDPRVVIGVIEGLVCARSLGSFGDDEEETIHKALLRLVKYGTGRVQEVATWAIGEMGRVEAVSTLCDLLIPSSSEGLLVEACRALGKINDARSVRPLLELFEGGTHEAAMIAAIRALTAAGDARVLPAFVSRAFSETSPAVDQTLDEAFAALCSPAEESVRGDLESPDEEKKLAAIRRAINDPRLVFALMKHVLYGSEAVRAAAVDVLQRQHYDLLILTRSALRLADKAEARRVLAISLLTSLRPDDAASLLDGLLVDDNEPVEIYRHSVAALQRIGTEPALAILRKHENHPKEIVREYVRAALTPRTPDAPAA